MMQTFKRAAFLAIGMMRRLLRIGVGESASSNASLLIRIDHIGDVICSLPAIEHFLSENPAGTTDVLVKPNVAPIFQETVLHSHIMLFHGKSFVEIFRSCMSISRKKYGSIYILHTRPSILVALIALFSPRSVCIGFAFKSLYDMLLDKPKAYRPLNANRHRYEGSIVFDIFADHPLGHEVGNPRAFSAVSKVIGVTSAGSNARKQKVAFFTTVNKFDETRMWAREKFAELAKRFIDQCDAEIFLYGGPTDYEYNESLRSMIANDSVVHNMSGKIPFPRVPEKINEMDFIVSLASGLMHVAMSLHKPMVIIAGSTNIDRWVRKEYHKDVVIASVPCQPCEFVGKINKCVLGGVHCMNQITVDMVWSKVQAGMPQEQHKKAN
jgi:ADP-heptose:LPS heptosyltransferase